MNAPVKVHPHGLWSLWDMLELKAGDFLAVARHCAELGAWIGATESAQPEQEERIFHPRRRLEDEDTRFALQRFEGLKPHLEQLCASVTLLAVEDAIEELGRPYATWGHVKKHLDAIQDTLRRELTLVTLLTLTPQERSYFEPSAPLFGPDVAKKFPTECAFEIDEAGKCYALGRTTAAVFHLMRVMEVGLKAISACLGIPDPAKGSDRNWGKMLTAIHEEMDERTSKKGGKKWNAAGDKELFQRLHASLDAIRAAWRNTTMHVEGKYMPAEGEAIFVSVKMFMTALAARCDETGSPLA